MARRRSRILIGLNSGTSADGVDAAAVEIHGRGEAMRVRCLGHVAHAYPPELRRRILSVMAPAETRTEGLCLLDVEIGTAFADAAEAVSRRLNLRHLDAIGSHGQTICHLPPGRDSKRESKARTIKKLAGTFTRAGGASMEPLPDGRGAVWRSRRGLDSGGLSGTMQIGDPATIAARIRSPVVSHFRQADMAAGGQGAPLVPWTDWILLRHPKRTRIIQNIGGIANLTYLPAGGMPDDVIAFDTGPGNMLIDALASYFSNGRETCDRDGRGAARGRFSREVLDALLKHPFLRRLPPKSCGREEFGVKFVRSLLKKYGHLGLSREDWLAAATLFTAISIAKGHIDAQAIHYMIRHEQTDLAAIKAAGAEIEVILCGGGTSNPALIDCLQRNLADCMGKSGKKHLATTADHGIPIDAKEAVSFAVLAAARMDRVPANLPQVTGARRRVVLGMVSEA